MKLDSVHVILNHKVSKCAQATFVQLPEEVGPWIALMKPHTCECHRFRLCVLMFCVFLA